MKPPGRDWGSGALVATAVIIIAFVAAVTWLSSLFTGPGDPVSRPALGDPAAPSATREQPWGTVISVERISPGAPTWVHALIRSTLRHFPATWSELWETVQTTTVIAQAFVFIALAVTIVGALLGAVLSPMSDGHGEAMPFGMGLTWAIAVALGVLALMRIWAG